MTTTFGTVRRSGERFDLDFERVYATTVEDVWSAMTDPERLARWMGRYTGDLRLGGRWDALNDDGSVYSSGTVTACDPPRSYTTGWEYEGEPDSTLTIVVGEHPDGAVLTLRHEGLVDLEYGAGWQTYLERLDEALPVAPSSSVDPDRRPGVAWEERFAELQEVWGPRLESVLAADDGGAPGSV